MISAIFDEKFSAFDKNLRGLLEQNYSAVKGNMDLIDAKNSEALISIENLDVVRRQHHDRLENLTHQFTQLRDSVEDYEKVKEQVQQLLDQESNEPEANLEIFKKVAVHEQTIEDLKIELQNQRILNESIAEISPVAIRRTSMYGGLGEVMDDDRDRLTRQSTFRREGPIPRLA
jgi:predicted RNase H-like nuclease (RuvC/YqgF family)